MTLNEFLSELVSHGKTTEWNLLGANLQYIRTQDKKGRILDPVTFLCQKKHNRYYSIFDIEKAGHKLGLSRDDTWNLLFAADFNENDYRAKLDTTAIFDIGLRVRLEEICIRNKP